MLAKPAALLGYLPQLKPKRIRACLRRAASGTRTYYERAKVANNYKSPWIPDREVPQALGIRVPEFRWGNVVPFVWRYASPDRRRTLGTYTILSYAGAFDRGKAHHADLRNSPNIHVLLHANLTSFSGSPNGAAIESITVQSLTQRSMTIKAKMFVLC